MSAGIRLEYMPYYLKVEPSPEVQVDPVWDWRRFNPYAYFRFVYDNENARYFPDRGFRVKASYDYNFRRAHFVAAGIHGVIPCTKFFAVVASANGRYIFGHDNDNVFMDNYVGGTMPGRYYEQQIPFIGYNSASRRESLLTTADLELRFKVWKKIYLSAIGAVMHDGETLAGMKDNHPVYAAALQFGYNSKFGPLMANLHWNSRFHRVGFYLGFGYDF
jgi:NTE family protein